MSGRAARWWLGTAGAALVLVGLGAAANGTLTYSRSPADLFVGPSHVGERVRVEGTVVTGSLSEQTGVTSFVLEGGGARAEVKTTEVPSGTFRAGADAVVEGVLGADGVLDVDRVMAKHANTYRADDGREGDGAAGSAP